MALRSFQFRLHGANQVLLGGILSLQGRENGLIDGALCDDVVDRDHLLLPLPPEAGVGLGIEFQAPDQGEPEYAVFCLMG